MKRIILQRVRFILTMLFILWWAIPINIIGLCFTIHMRIKEGYWCTKYEWFDTKIMKDLVSAISIISGYADLEDYINLKD